MSVERTSSSTVTVRRIRERATPAPWWPGGCLPLALLGLIGLYLTFWLPQVIEQSIERDVQARLDREGYDWADVQVNGQHVTLAGRAPSEAVADRALQAAEGVRSTTWSGMLVSPVDVTAAFAEVGEPAPPPPRANWLFRRGESDLTLTGMVTDEAARDEIVQAAQAVADRQASIGSVIDQLEVGAGGPEGGAAPGVYGLSLLEQCLTGRVTLKDARLGIACEVKEQRNETEVRDRLEQLPEDVERGAISLLVKAKADACDDALAALLKQPIRFASAQATVERQSFGLLDDIATASRACPGKLRIEGHTDSTGTPGFNKTLSGDRAVAVKAALVERGVEAERLTTAGFGQDRPIASNNTKAGRRANRRIEISVVRSSDQ